METKQPSQISTALVYVDDKPFWELTVPEIAYPLTIEQDGRDFRFYCHLKPYRAYELKKTLGEVGGTGKMVGKEMEILPDNDQFYKPLCDSCFLRFTGTSSDQPEDHKAYLDENPWMKLRIVKEGFGGIMLDFSEDHQPVSALTFTLRSDAGSRVATHQTLYSPEREIEDDVKLVHHLCRDTELDYQRWDKASKRKVNLRTSEWRLDPNYDVLEGLYKDLIRKADGFLFEGAPCEETNKEQWVGIVPLWHKILVINQVFRIKKG